MLLTETMVGLFAAAVLGVFSGAITSAGAFFAFLMFLFFWSETSGNGLTKVVKVTVFIIVGVLFLGLGGILAPLALGVYVAVGIFNTDSALTPGGTPGGISFFVFYFGTILVYLVFYLKDILADRKSTVHSKNEGEQDVDAND